MRGRFGWIFGYGVAIIFIIIITSLVFVLDVCIARFLLTRDFVDRNRLIRFNIPGSSKCIYFFYRFSLYRKDTVCVNVFLNIK